MRATGGNRVGPRPSANIAIVNRALQRWRLSADDFSVAHPSQPWPDGLSANLSRRGWAMRTRCLIAVALLLAAAPAVAVPAAPKECLRRDQGETDKACNEAERS